jgi:hypothetical protein
VEERIKDEWSYSNGDGETPDEVEDEAKEVESSKDIVDEALEQQN